MGSQVTESWKRVKATLEYEEVVGTILIKKILTKNPEIYALFPFSKDHAINSDSLSADPAFKETGSKMINTIDKIIDMMSKGNSSLFEVLKLLGIRLRISGVKAEHYDAFEEALMETLTDTIGNDFTSEVKTSWQTFYKIVKTSMIDGARYDEDISQVAPKSTFSIKLPWLVASVLSLIYVGMYVLVVKKIIDPSALLFEFLGWGSPETDEKVIKCSELPLYYRLIVLGIDGIIAIIANVLCGEDSRMSSRNTVIYFSSAIVMVIHGILHFFIYNGINCIPDNAGELGAFGGIFFGAFTLLLSLVVLGFGFGKKSWVVPASIASTALVVIITKDDYNAGQYTLSSLYVIVHPLICITGYFTKEPTFSPTAGKWCVVAALVGVLELLVKGHFWYDLTLHVAILASLPWFSDKTKKMKRA